MLYLKFFLIASALSFSITQADLIKREKVKDVQILSKRDDPLDEDPEEPKPVRVTYEVPDCGNVDSACDLNCKWDVSCQALGWNHTTLPCACPAILCSDGYLYGYPDYKRAPALVGDSLAKQSHVVAPCNDCVPAEIAPKQKAIGNCPKSN